MLEQVGNGGTQGLGMLQGQQLEARNICVTKFCHFTQTNGKGLCEEQWNQVMRQSEVYI